MQNDLDQIKQEYQKQYNHPVSKDVKRKCKNDYGKVMLALLNEGYL